MKKSLLILFFCATFANAGVINAIVLTVNDSPITLVDIDNTMVQKGVKKEEAIAIQIDEALYNQSIEKFKINIDSFDIENYIEKLAQNNHMTSYEFKNALKQQQDYEQFKEKVRLQLRHQKLVSAIASNKLTIATDDDLKIYYDNNQEQFQIAKTIDALHYKSKDKKLLEALKLNPMMANNNVIVENVKLSIENVTPQMKYIISQTKPKTFSAIFAENQTYNLLFISNKSDMENISFESVKDTIFNILMTQREEEYLKTYFETLKVTANIKFLR